LATVIALSPREIFKAAELSGKPVYLYMPLRRDERDAHWKTLARDKYHAQAVPMARFSARRLVHWD
jgi:hypothetical protein